MPDLDKTDSPLPTTTVKWRFPSIHPEGRKYVVGAAFVTMVVYLAVSHFVGWLLVGLTIWVATFFRDPIRTTPRADRLIVAPADGLITMIARVPPPPELRGAEGMAEGDYTRVSIFMSVFDVHINRAPISGRVKRIAYVPGKFINADLDKASEDNERQHFLIEGLGRGEDRLHPDRRAGRSADPRLRPRRRHGRRRAAHRPDPLRQPGRRLSARRHRAQGAARATLDRRGDGDRGDRRGRVAGGHQPVNGDEDPRRIPFRAMIPNAITALALCLGLTGVSLAIRGEWERALGAIVLAGVLDGLDGRIARLLRAQSRFGAELDSLSDNIAFGTAPALILFLWSLQAAPRFGWIAALALAVCCALRLARFNARMDAAEQPHKSAGFNTGVPAPAGAGVAFIPIYLWLITGNPVFQRWELVMPWTLLIAALMISSLPTYSWSSIRIRPAWRLFALAGIALLGAALVIAPWITLLAVSCVYLLMIPVALTSYAKVKLRRASSR